MLIKNEKLYRYAAWGIFALIFALILCTFRDYGITWDEELQSQYGRAVVDYYASFFKDQSYDQIFNLYLYGGMFDGLASVIDHFTPFSTYETRHLINALFGLLGLMGVWKLGCFLGARRTAQETTSGGAVGLVALILCATTPMYYGHMYNNPKDIPFAVGIIWTLYFMCRSYAKPTWRVLIRLGIIYGLTLGIRVGGVMLFMFWLAPMGIAALLPLWKTRDMKTVRAVALSLWHRGWRIVLPVGVMSYVVMLICWPWAQQDPIMNPLRALHEFSNFPQIVDVLLDGTTYSSVKLPWFYVPLYFSVQLPEILLFLLAVSVLFSPLMWRRMAPAQRQGITALSLMIAVPVSYAVIRRPALYDAVRHFLFVAPLVCIVAAVGADTAFRWIIARFENKKFRCAAGTVMLAAFALCIAGQIYIMVRLHPYEYIYANALTGGVHGAYGRYESDYWGSSFKEAAADLQAYVAKEGGVPTGKIYRIAICGPADAAMIYLPPDFRAVDAGDAAEFFLSTTRWKCQDMRPGKVIITVKRMGAPLSVVKDLRGGYELLPGSPADK
ncbi:MAG: glycosyltransferase family 39 protein [Alphaproteobacteria bacterium]|nr:glycosyltransferase family 39 protein [Alphaproteobacteria bacterium]